MLKDGCLVVCLLLTDKLTSSTDNVLKIGMATRLSFNLALHQDLKPYIAKCVLSEAEADLRRTVFWAAFVVDQWVAPPLRHAFF